MSQELQQSFCRPYGRYYWPFTPDQLAFNENLQDFASEVGTICKLQTNGKLSAEDAYRKIFTLWEVLKESQDNLLGSEPE
jgi:hypothetical protein